LVELAMNAWGSWPLWEKKNLSPDKLSILIVKELESGFLEKLSQTSWRASFGKDVTIYRLPATLLIRRTGAWRFGLRALDGDAAVGWH
jgi:hypothetical protein